jgi:hypothetical protein
MRRFLRETWELWYWAMFCPSKLQQRMNEWAPAEEKDGRRPDTHSRDIILYRFNFRFFRQFLLLLLCFTAPLTLTIAIEGQGLNWLLLPLVLLVAYGTSFWFLPVGMPIPLLCWLVYREQHKTWSVLSGNGLPTQIWLFALLAIGVTSLFLLFARKDRQSNNEVVGLVFIVAVGVAGGVAVGVVAGMVVAVVDQLAFVVITVVAAGVVGGVVAGLIIGMAGTAAFVVGVALAFVVAVGMAIVATLSLPLFMLICWLVALNLAPAKSRWLGIITGGILTALSFKHLDSWSLLAVPVTLVSYYRLLPDYLMLSCISLSPSIALFSRLRSKPLLVLRLLPPYTTELLWLPLPNHDRILAAAFHTDASAALATFQQMQASSLPGFKHTIKQALPQIVADQLAAVSTIPELVITAPQPLAIFWTGDAVIGFGNSLLAVEVQQHPILPLLLPTLYQEEQLPQPASSPVVEAEIYILLPKLHTIAKNVNAALEAGNAALRERGLERILNNLGMLQAQLPGLGLKATAIKRWQPVIKRWQRVIELELEEQQKQSQGELLNPFQYGNPLRCDRSYLFKGRQAFADNIVRLILDRNRPTLVLHGPRRFGKSSFLLNLPRLLPTDMLPIYLDMQSAAVTTDEAAFCQGLVRAISKDSGSQGVELPAIPQRKEFLDTPYIALEDWLEQAMSKLGDRRLLLNLDEFEKIGSAINQGRMSLNLFNELRHLIQHYDQLGFLFSGVQTLDELGPNWSSYFISVVPIEMLYLEPHEAEDLLVNPDPEFTLRYDTGIVEEILILTRCHPYLLQLIGWSLVKLANENHTQLVTSDLLQAAIPEAFTNGQPYFTNVWTEFPGTSPAEVKAGQELLLALAQGNQSSSVAGNETAQAARRRLLRYHVIENINGSDRFEVPLIERWVRERAITN